MQEKKLGLMGGGKRKAISAIACAALVLALGAATAFAAGTVAEEGQATGLQGSGNASGSAQSSGEFGLHIEYKNGVIRYSMDGGETWSDTAPGGVKLPTGANVMLKNENGVISHSIDGGATWAEGYPKGSTIEDDGDGNIRVSARHSIDKADLSGR